MSAEKPNFLSQPVVKNVFMFRNGDPYYEARRIVINQRRVCNFETLLREVTGGIQAPFGAVRNIYTPRGGHKVDCLEGLRSGEQYVAAGRERFRKLDYLQIGSRRKRMMQMLPMQAKPPPQNRITASPRFLKPIKEPCLIFVVANGDIINPAVRLLIHQRMLEQFDKILEMITEKMGLRVLGGVRSLYTFEGNQVTDGKQLGSGHHYVAVGREKFKKLPYSDLLLTKRRGTRRVNGISAYSLPPIYRFPKQNGNSKSVFQASDGGGDSKTFPPAHRHNSKEHLSSIVREISQARLISLRKKRSGQSMSLGVTDNDDLESKPVDGNSENQTPEDQPAEEKPAADDPKTTEENGEEAEEKEKQEKQEEEEAAETTNEDCCSGGGEEEEKQEASSKGEEDKKENAQPNGETEGEKEQGAGDAKEDEAEEDIKNEMVDESKQEVKKEEQSSIDTNSGNAKDRKEGRNESRPPSKIETEQEDKHGQVETKDQDSGESESGSKDAANDGDAGEEENENNDRGKAHADNESKESHSSRSSSSNSNQEGDVTKANRSATKESGGGEERKENGETSGEDDEVESESEQKTERKKASSRNDAAETTAQGENRNKNEDESRKETD